MESESNFTVNNVIMLGELVFFTVDGLIENKKVVNQLMNNFDENISSN